MRDDTATGAALELRQLAKEYHDVVAVDAISLGVEPGEFLTLLGPSGSGKTSTLNMIAGFIEASSGEILLGGRSIAEVPPHRRNIGMVFQNYALFPHMTAFENVAFPLKQRRVRREEIRERVEATLALVGLGHVGHRYPRQLSGGQQQRVALARAIVFQPPLLLMDEPLGALDKKLREGLQLEIKRIHREMGITFIYVTHDQEEALVLSDRIAVFNQGRIEQVATGDEVYEQPATLFVAEFIGESNVFRGRAYGTEEMASVRTDLVELRGRNVGETVAGPAALVVRPERVRVFPESNVPSGDLNVLSGSIEDTFNLGSARKLTVRLDTGGHATAREATEHRVAAAIGDRVHVAWSPHDSLILPDQALDPTVVGHVQDMGEQVEQLIAPGAGEPAATSDLSADNPLDAIVGLPAVSLPRR